MTQPSAPHIPHFEGPVPCDDEDPPTRHRLVLGALAALTAVASAAALLVAHPWQADGRQTQPVLRHVTVERFLIDSAGARTPVCNGAADIPAATGATFSCVQGTRTWRMRIDAVTADQIKYVFAP